MAIRKRYSTTSPGEVTGYAVGLPRHTAKDGGIVWYGGGKLAADLTLPKLRRRWAGLGTEPGAVPGSRPVGCGGACRAPEHGHRRRRSRHVMRRGSSPGCGRPGCWCGCGSARSSPGQVTGYAVGLPGHDASDGDASVVRRRAAGRRADPAPAAPRLGPRLGARAERSGAFRFTVPERNAIFEHAARQAAAAAEHIRRSARGDPAGGGGRGMGSSRHPARRGAGPAQPGTAPCRRQLRPRRPRPVRPDPALPPTRETSCAPPPG